MYFVMLYDGSSSGDPVRVSETYDQHPSPILSVSGRTIYSKVTGFLSASGVVAWAILVTHTCQIDPSAVAGTVVSRFYIFSYLNGAQSNFSIWILTTSHDPTSIKS